MGRFAGRVVLVTGASSGIGAAVAYALAASLRAEVLADGVAVVLVSPGFVESEIRRVDNQGVHHPEARDPVPPWLVMPADRPAPSCAPSAAVDASGRHLAWKLGVWLARHLPTVVAFALERGASRSRGEPTAAPR